MFKKISILLLLVFCFLSFFSNVSAMAPLPLAGFVNDPTHSLTNEEQLEIQKRLSDYETTHDITIMIFIDYFDDLSLILERYKNTRTMFIIVDQINRDISFNVNSSLTLYLTQQELSFIVETIIGPKLEINQLSEGLSAGITAIQQELPEKKLAPLATPLSTPFVFDVKVNTPSETEKSFSQFAETIRNNNIDLYIQITLLVVFILSLILERLLPTFVSKEVLKKKFLKTFLDPITRIALIVIVILTGIFNTDKRLQISAATIIFTFFVITIITLTIYLSLRIGKSKSVWLGPLLGAFIGIFFGYTVGDITDLIDWTIILTAFGLMIDALASYITNFEYYYNQRQKKKPTL